MKPLDKIDKLGIIMGIEIMILAIGTVFTAFLITVFFGPLGYIACFVISVLLAIVMMRIALIISRHAEKKEKEIFKNKGN